MTTNDDGTLRRVPMYNDVVGGQRNKDPRRRDPARNQLPHVGVARRRGLVQLGRLDDLLTDMRRRQAEIKAASPMSLVSRALNSAGATTLTGTLASRSSSSLPFRASHLDR